MKSILAAAMIACAIPAGGSAQQVVLSANNVVGASSVYGRGAGSEGAPFVRNGDRVIDAYGAGNLFNSQLTAPPVEAFGSGQYFLTGDGQSAATVHNPYVTVDLGAVYTLASFALYNTSNGAVNDRGTAGFTIFGANALAADGPNGFTLGGATTVLAQGTLVQQTSATAPAAQSFASLSNQGVRYIQFVPTSATASNLYNAQSYGLNELKVFAGAATPGAVPEPATWAMMLLGFGGVGHALRRRRGVATRIRFV